MKRTRCSAWIVYGKSFANTPPNPQKRSKKKSLTPFALFREMLPRKTTLRWLWSSFYEQEGSPGKIKNPGSEDPALELPGKGLQNRIWSPRLALRMRLSAIMENVNRRTAEQETAVYRSEKHCI